MRPMVTAHCLIDVLCVWVSIGYVAERKPGWYVRTICAELEVTRRCFCFVCKN